MPPLTPSAILIAFLVFSGGGQPLCPRRPTRNKVLRDGGHKGPAPPLRLITKSLLGLFRLPVVGFHDFRDSELDQLLLKFALRDLGGFMTGLLEHRRATALDLTRAKS